MDRGGHRAPLEGCGLSKGIPGIPRGSLIRTIIEGGGRLAPGEVPKGRMDQSVVPASFQPTNSGTASSHGTKGEGSCSAL